MSFHIYADDTQIYTSFDPRLPEDRNTAVEELEKCIIDINNWMVGNKLKLNMGKTEFLVVGSSHNLRAQPSLTLRVGNTVVKSVRTVRNLGVAFDNDASMTGQVRGLCRTTISETSLASENTWMRNPVISSERWSTLASITATRCSMASLLLKLTNFNAFRIKLCV